MLSEYKENWCASADVEDWGTVPSTYVILGELYRYKDQVNVLTDTLYKTNNLVAQQAKEIQDLEDYVKELLRETQRIQYTHERDDY